MHECPYCGQACDCDGEDTWLEAPVNCQCEINDYAEDESDYEDDFDDDYEDDDPCFQCGPWCHEWGGDGLCMIQIRAQAEANRYEALSETWHGRLVLRLEDLRNWIAYKFLRLAEFFQRPDEHDEDELPF